jgi:hypothetical protein
VLACEYQQTAGTFGIAALQGRDGVLHPDYEPAHLGGVVGIHAFTQESAQIAPQMGVVTVLQLG